MATTNRYTFAQRLLHWVVALLVLGLLLAGLAFWALGYDGLVGLLGEEMTGELYKYHKSFGILLLLLTLLRIGLRFAAPPPAYDPPIGGLERVVGAGIHLLLYALLLGMPIVGWLATAAAGYPVQFFDWQLPGLIGKDEALSETLFAYHGLAGLAVAGLLVLHIGAALKHWRLKDGIVRRISLP